MSSRTGALPTPRAGRYWPTPGQGHLLRAALLRGDAALDAWAHWKQTTDLTRLDKGSERLLPLLAHNLTRCGVRDVQLGRYAGILRHTLVTNLRRIARASKLVRSLHEAHVPVMLLKGMALARLYYSHPGLRPMDDADLLVPTADARRAIDVLRACGWHPAGPESDLAAAHSRPFTDGQSGRVDLHWHALWEACGPDEDADADVWTHADHARLDDTPIRVPGPADLLFQVIVHGARWNAVPPVRWVADAMTILSAPDRAVDWGRLVAEARHHGLVLPVKHALGFLVETLEARVPLDVLAALDAHQPSVFERVEQRMREWTSPRVGCFPVVLCHHVRLTRAAGPLAVVRQLPGYLQRAYGLPALRSLPASLVGRAVRRLWGRSVTIPS